MPVAIGLAGLIVDVGHWYEVSRQAQATADAGALDGARYLPNAPDQARTVAQGSVVANLPSATADVCISPGDLNCDRPDPEDIEVTVHATANTFFAKLFGFGSVAVSAKAVARRAIQQAPAGLFAGGTGCDPNRDGIHWSGSSSTINGAVITNGAFTVSGSNNSATSASYWASNPNGCTPSVAVSNSLPINGSLFGDPVEEPWPVSFSTSDFNCDFTFSADKNLNSVAPLRESIAPSATESRSAPPAPTGT